VEVGEELGEGRRHVRVSGADDEAAAIAAVGVVPLPPYVHEALDDPERYQTVFARAEAASVAAPTAGLHLTHEVLDRCRAAGAEVAEVELEVGLGTFRPIVVDRLEDHVMHAERYRVPEATAEACRRAERVVAVGTTAVRALEAAARTGEPAGTTDLFLAPGAELVVVDALLTNFHLPRSTLLALVDLATGGRWRALYDEALAEGYRFLSFGDAMFVPAVAGRGRGAGRGATTGAPR
jgi:S-adenosylmethionine:tRNA ribosyltransferase-isomerase